MLRPCSAEHAKPAFGSAILFGMLFSMAETEQTHQRQTESVWEDSSWETALATRRVVRKRSPVMRQPKLKPAPPLPAVTPVSSPALAPTPAPSFPKEEMIERVAVYHHGEERKTELTEADFLRVRKALQRDSQTVQLPSGKGHLLSFCLLFTTCFFLEGALFATSLAFMRALNASERVPLSLPIRPDLSDTQ